MPSPQVGVPRDANDGEAKHEPLQHQSGRGWWMLPVLLISSVSIVGALASGYAGTAIPLWVLLGFSIIFSIKKWLYWTRKYEHIWKLYKLLLNLSTLSMIVVIIQSGGRLFSGEFARSPLIGSMVFLGEVVFLIWVVGVVHSNRSRWPSMTLTVFSLAVIVAVFAFAGVEPFSSYKGDVSARGAAYWAKLRASAKEHLSSYNVQPGTEGRKSGTGQGSDTPAGNPIVVPTPVVPPLIKPVKPPEGVTPDSERIAFGMINAERKNAGVPPTVWNDQLYKLSLAHTQEMAKQGRLFHTPMEASYGENAWGGKGYARYSNEELAKAIVSSWMSSPLHRAWILHAPLRTSVVSIVAPPDGQYSSWTFWTNEAGAGPPLVQRAYALWQAETGGRVEWLTWLYDVKGYPGNIAFLKQLGVQ